MHDTTQSWGTGEQRRILEKGSSRQAFHKEWGLANTRLKHKDKAWSEHTRQGVRGAQSLRGDEGDHSKRPPGRSVGEGGKGGRIEIYCARAVPTKNKTKITTPVGPCLRRGDC